MTERFPIPYINVSNFFKAKCLRFYYIILLLIVIYF